MKTDSKNSSKDKTLSSLLNRLKESAGHALFSDENMGKKEFLNQIKILEKAIKEELNNNSNNHKKSNKANKAVDSSEFINNEIENFYTSLIENSSDDIWSIDESYNIIALNTRFKSSFKEAFGITLVKGLNILTALPEPYKTEWRRRYDRALAGELFSKKDHFEIKNCVKIQETLFKPIGSKNKIIGVTCISKEFSDPKVQDEKLDFLANVSPVPITVHDENNFYFVNKAWEILTGITQGEALKLKPIDILSAVPENEIQDQIRKIIRKEITGFNATIRIRGNENIPISISGYAIVYKGRLAILTIVNDNTKIIEELKSLKQYNNSLKSLINNTKADLWSVNTDLELVTWNDSFQKNYKKAFNVDIKSGTSALEGVKGKLRLLWEEKYKKALNGEQCSYINELHIKGLPEYIETTLDPIHLDDAIAGVSCFSQDVTQRIKQQEALISSEKKYKTLVANLPSVTYRCANDKDWTMEFISDEILNLSGYPATDFINNDKRTFASIIHPDDRSYVDLEVNKGTGNYTLFELEYRIIHSNGSIRWAHERGRGIYDDKGNILWLDGVISDITQQKVTEIALQKSEEKYRNILNSINDIIIQTDIEGIIEFVSDSVKKIYGYNPNDLIGKNILELYKNKNQRKGLIEKLQQNNEIQDFEFEFVTSDGSEKTVSINASLRLDENNKTIGIDGIIRDVTLRKIAEKTLRERTKELNSIFDNVPSVLLLINAHGNVININRTMISPADNNTDKHKNAIIKKLLDCIRGISNTDGCGLGNECNNCIIRKVIQETFGTRQNFNRKDGKITVNINGKLIERYFVISTSYIDSEEEERVLISFDDVTEIRLAQEQVKKLSTALEQSYATVVITDLKGNIEYANPQFEISTGYKLEEAIGKNPRMLKSSNTKPEVYKFLWQTILNGNTWQGEFLNKRKDGTEYWENAIISPIYNDNDEIINFIAVKEDITERKKIRDELIRSEKELRMLNEEKSRFFSILAHDLRGVIGGFHAYTDLLYTHFDNFSKEDVKEQLVNLANASKESINLLDGLLDWGKTSMGKIQITPSYFDIKDEVESILKILKEVASAKNISLYNRVGKEINILADANIFDTIVRNLVSNAIKFTPAGGEVKIESKKMENNYIEISVIDNGIGVEPEILQKLFKAGEKVIKEGTNQEKGTGLGLLICEELVKKLGGEIKAESIWGQGSRFFFLLPLN